MFMSHYATEVCKCPKIMERIRKLIRLKKSTTSEGEANNAAILVNRLLREYNLSLLDINERQPEEKFQISVFSFYMTKEAKSIFL